MSKIKEIENSYREIKAFFKRGVFPEKNLFRFLQNVGSFENERRTREILGHEGEFKENVRLQVWDLLKAILLRDDKPLNVLIIENRPGRLLSEIDERFNNVLKEKNNFSLKQALNAIFGRLGKSIIYIRDDKFDELYEQFIKAKQKKQKKTVINCKKLTNDSSNYLSVNIDNMHLILVDIFLGEKVDGVDFVNVLREIVPHVPTFILSVTNDYRVVQQAFDRGADFYITKNQLFSVPFLYDAYINEMGEVIKHINDEALQKSLLGNIRYWRYKKNYLSFGDKCFHMIDHSYDHIADDWEATNQLLVPLLRTNLLQAEYKFGEKR